MAGYARYTWPFGPDCVPEEPVYRLDARELRCVQGRLQGRTLRAVGADMGLSASRADQLVRRAERKIARALGLPAGWRCALTAPKPLRKALLAEARDWFLRHRDVFPLRRTEYHSLEVVVPEIKIGGTLVIAARVFDSFDPVVLRDTLDQQYDAFEREVICTRATKEK